MRMKIDFRVAFSIKLCYNRNILKGNERTLLHETCGFSRCGGGNAGAVYKI